MVADEIRSARATASSRSLTTSAKCRHLRAIAQIFVRGPDCGSRTSTRSSVGRTGGWASISAAPRAGADHQHGDGYQAPADRQDEPSLLIPRRLQAVQCQRLRARNDIATGPHQTAAPGPAPRAGPDPANGCCRDRIVTALTARANGRGSRRSHQHLCGRHFPPANPRKVRRRHHGRRQRLDGQHAPGTNRTDIVSG